MTWKMEYNKIKGGSDNA